MCLIDSLLDVFGFILRTAIDRRKELEQVWVFERIDARVPLLVDPTEVGLRLGISGLLYLRVESTNQIEAFALRCLRFSTFIFSHWLLIETCRHRNLVKFAVV